MPEPRFDPAMMVTFDFDRGAVELDATSKDDARAIVVAADALLALAEAAGGDAVKTFGRTIGERIGRRASERSGAEGGARGASLASVVDLLGGEMAVVGLGALSIERWGDALVVVVDGSPFGAAGDALLASAIEGALSVLSGRSVGAALLERSGARARFFVGGARGRARVAELLMEGKTWGETLVKLHARGGA